jgi:nucleotide-binding universal stress UspA family protein
VLIAGTDGSEASIESLRAGLALLPEDEEVLLVTAVEHGDHSLVTGGGMAGGVMSEDEFVAQDTAVVTDAQESLAQSAERLGLVNARTLVVRGAPGDALCQLAAERGARAIVLGTRGRGGVKRALLGSVSDHVVRNAPCPVVITGPTEASE